MNTKTKLICFILYLSMYYKLNTPTLITNADAKTSQAVYIDINPKGDSLGDQWIFDQPLLDENGAEIGTISGFCLRTKIASSSQC